MPKIDYSKQRAKRTPPHVPLKALRTVSGMTLDEVCERLTEELELDKPFTRGAMSAIESGTRGASATVLSALETVYRIQPGSLTTDYAPRAWVKDGAA